ncbi:phosphatidylinositol-glycan biosynthesis class W protein-like [Ostrinia furnacalis]|uniref:phosphatidylinositol-glycan biosynthesis class W protein-like n=1 Tax=Ostrinia furnacalis TaxID=93504 RepID=UPI001040D6B8|nr:phosphatidylinositol-glycan biosynthesis class W protein-like [Ostrinia furnacalis]
MDEKLLKMNATEYKKYHESFMTNNHGSTATHTFLYIFFTVQCSLFCSLSTKRPQPLQYILEYFLIVLPLIISCTTLSEYMYLLNCIVSTMLLTKIMLNYPKLQIHKTFNTKNYFKTSKLHSISLMRGLTYLMTVFCILAVDFQSFPRYLAKTEKYGFSVMDSGVGLFVLMSGLVHKDLRNQSLPSILKGNIKFLSILICLGVARFISVKQLDYQEHVTEYGVHWNFFFTVAICKLISTVLLYYCNNSILCGFVILGLHESMLHLGLKQWVFGNTPRTNIINANREGISSSLGYVSLYLFAAYLKSEIKKDTVQKYNVQLKLMFLSIIMSLLAVTAHFYSPASRTLANAGYCFYLQTVLVVIMMIMYFLEVQFQNKDLQFHVPLIISAINSNGLVYFLVANLLTGAINLLMRTLFISAFKSFIIQNIYMILTIFLAAYLKEKGISV